MRLLSCLTLSLALGSIGIATAHPTPAGAAVPLQQPSAPPSSATSPAPAASTAPVGAKVWIGRYAEYEGFLRTVEIDRVSGFKKGVTGKTRNAYFKPGALAAGGALRNIRPGRYDGYFESYKSEVAAYRLDRLLQLDLVPPTIERQYDGEPVSLQLRVENVKDLQDIKQRKIAVPSGSLAWIRQLARQRVFDDLVANIDENETNLLFDDQWNLIKIDCSRCFTNVMTEPFEIGKAVTIIDRPVFERVKALNRDTLQREIGAFVEGGAVDALLARRDDLVKKFEKLAKNKGEGQVFLP
jgi:hypothetical protein